MASRFNYRNGRIGDATASRLSHVGKKANSWLNHRRSTSTITWLERVDITETPPAIAHRQQQDIINSDEDNVLENCLKWIWRSVSLPGIPFFCLQHRRIRMKATTISLAIASCLGFTHVSHAEDISFASLAQSGTGFNYLGDTVTQQGFRFTSTGGQFGNQLGVWQNSSSNHPVGGAASTSLMDYYAGATTTMIATDNKAFQVKSIDLAPWATGNSGTFNVTISAIAADNTVVQQTFAVSNAGSASPRLQHFTFGSSFSDLVSMRFGQGVNAEGVAYQYNNIDVGPPAKSVSPVPEPSSAVLLACGLGLLLGSARKRRRR